MTLDQARTMLAAARDGADISPGQITRALCETGDAGRTATAKRVLEAAQAILADMPSHEREEIDWAGFIVAHNYTQASRRETV